MEEIEKKDLTRYKKSSLVFDLSLVPFGSRYIYLQRYLSSTEVSGGSATSFPGTGWWLRAVLCWACSSSAAEGAANACLSAACCAKPVYLNRDSVRSSFSD